jgi:hypothetical protein
MFRAQPPPVSRTRRERLRRPPSVILELLPPAYLILLGLVVTGISAQEDPVPGVLTGLTLAVPLGWIPEFLLPSRVFHSRGRGRTAGRAWRGVLGAVVSVSSGLVAGWWGQVPVPVLAVAVIAWGSVLIAVTASWIRPWCPQTALTVAVWTWVVIVSGPMALWGLLLVVPVVLASARTGRRGPIAVVGGAAIGVIVAVGATALPW